MNNNNICISSTSGNVYYVVYDRYPSSLCINGAKFLFKLSEMSAIDLSNNQDEKDRLRNLVEMIDSLNIKHIRPSKVNVDGQISKGLRFSVLGLLYISLDGYGHIQYNIEQRTVTYGNMQIIDRRLIKIIEKLLLSSTMSNLSQNNYTVTNYYTPTDLIDDICGYIIGCCEFICEEIKYAIKSKMSTKSARNLCT